MEIFAILGMWRCSLVTSTSARFGQWIWKRESRLTLHRVINLGENIFPSIRQRSDSLREFRRAYRQCCYVLGYLGLVASDGPLFLTASYQGAPRCPHFPVLPTSVFH